MKRENCTILESLHHSDHHVSFVELLLNKEMYY